MSDDASKFIWVGNHPGLDLINTAALDAHGDRIELVADWTDLVDWTQAAGLIDPDLAQQCRAATQRRGRSVLMWFRQLRSCLRTVLESDHHDAAAANTLDTTVATVAVRLSYQPGQQRDCGPLDPSKPLEQLRLALATVALDATRLDRSRVRRCGSPSCLLLYYDTTKNGSRRWCDMAGCGNRAKANAHYRRTRHPEPNSRRPTS
jgi:predicted RNA-binding Zn ribbon-like protein